MRGESAAKQQRNEHRHVASGQEDQRGAEHLDEAVDAEVADDVAVDEDSDDDDRDAGGQCQHAQHVATIRDGRKVPIHAEVTTGAKAVSTVETDAIADGGHEAMHHAGQQTAT